MKSRWSTFSAGQSLTGFRWSLALRIRDCDGYAINAFEFDSLKLGNNDAMQLRRLRDAVQKLLDGIDQIEQELREDEAA